MLHKIRFLRAGRMAALMLPLLAGTGLAANLDLQGSFSETGIWDSNPMRVTGGEESIWGSETSASLIVIGRTPESKADAKLTALRNQFNRSEFNSTDFHGTAGLSRHTQRLEAGIDGKLDYDTTRTSEITTFGRDVGSVRHTAYSLSPKVSYSLSQRSSVALAGNWLQSEYDSAAYSDYRIISLTPSASYNLTQLQQAMLFFQAQRYESMDSSDQYVDSLGPSLGWSASLTPKISARLSAGAMATKFHGYQNGSDDWEINPIFSGLINWRDESNTATLSATRSRQPYANGTESYLTDFSASEIYKVNPRLSLDFRASYQIAKQPPVSTNNLDYAWGLSAGSTYNITRRWDFTASYRYRKETLSDNLGEANQNIIRVGLSYKPDFGKWARAD